MPFIGDTSLWKTHLSSLKVWMLPIQQPKNQPIFRLRAGGDTMLCVNYENLKTIRIIQQM